MNTNSIPAAANVRTADLVARADGSPIIVGTVNYYIIANTGANAGKWFKTSDDSWQAAEAIAGVMSHKADGHWQVSVDAACWIDGVEYTEYAKESGDLHIPVSADCVCHYRTTVSSAGDANTNVKKVNGTSQTANDNGADINTILSRVTAAVALASVCTDARLAHLDADVSSRSNHTANDAKANLTTLEARLSAARAGYLDELAAANLPADIDTLLTRVTATVASAVNLSISAEKIAFLRHMFGGTKREIIEAAPNWQWVFYGTGGLELCKFNCFDSAGNPCNPSTTAVAKLEKVV